MTQAQKVSEADLGGARFRRNSGLPFNQQPGEDWPAWPHLSCPKLEWWPSGADPGLGTPRLGSARSARAETTPMVAQRRWAAPQCVLPFQWKTGSSPSWRAATGSIPGYHLNKAGGLVPDVRRLSASERLRRAEGFRDVMPQ